jgi:hypothetical protein
MKLRAIVSTALLLLASLARAEEVQTALAPDGTLYAVAKSEGSRLELSRRRGDARETLVVPGTDDEAIESQARLAYDTAAGTLFVLWHRAAEGVDEIRLASLDADGWTEAPVVASGADARRAALQLVLTHARGEGDEADSTLLHLAWWSIGTRVVPEYALVAYENGQHLSTELLDLEAVADAPEAMDYEETGKAEHPPLAMARRGSGVDVVFGRDHSTAITRVRVEARRIAGNARPWRPGGRSLQSTGAARLISNGSAPVQAMVGGDRVVLYTPDEKFRYLIFAAGQWTPIRMIELDENVTTEDLLQELRRTLDENAPLETKPQSE